MSAFPNTYNESPQEGEFIPFSHQSISSSTLESVEIGRLNLFAMDAGPGPGGTPGPGRETPNGDSPIDDSLFTLIFALGIYGLFIFKKIQKRKKLMVKINK
ncbi:hypothetical protein M2138_000639 [Dysgonomonadaceae bacterium PH5-43]|nr:hypothetical protein [Dysgonomonadaceae bacterium PH5-43]